MEVIFSGLSMLAAILTETSYQKSLVNHLFSFDLDKKLVLVKQNSINPLKNLKSNQIYNPDKFVKKHSINSEYNVKEKELKIYDIKESTKHLTDFNSVKKKEIANSKSKQNIVLFSRKASNQSSIFDMRGKNACISKKKSIFQKEDSNRILNDKKDITKENDIEMNSNLDKSEKESNISKDTNIITRIELNQFKPKFCYRKRREHFEKILFEEAMKIILTKLDVQNLFKKLYKDEPEISEKNSKYEFIEMSDDCKKELQNILDGYVRTLDI